ncbi:MAG: class I SAM-dependent methyltransferase [Nitrospirales bacterium]|nr:class I SAM-dependent methyltransferase [Nitrospira sp.]MDR4501626.1 class I SAM-dependent methyltransferase [Nitrospirales bacterium]
MNTSCYDKPEYYEVAFSFRDISAEVRVIQTLISDYAQCDVKRIMQLACGPSQHMLTLNKAGFDYIGVDINSAMIDYSSQLAQKHGVNAEFYQQDMVRYRVDTPVDCVFIALGDLYVTSTNELRMLFDSVANSLNVGGLFLLDWCVQFQPERFFDATGQTWSISKDAVRIDSLVEMRPLDRVEQTFQETLTMNIHEGDRHTRLESASQKRAIFPQEFLMLVESSKTFEFIGWWNNWNLSQPISAATIDFFRPITLLRRI